MKAIIFALVTLFLLMSQSGFSQNARLAKQYYKDGEYEKAAQVYQRLYEKDHNVYYFNEYIRCLVELGDFDEARKRVQQELKSQDGNAEMYVLLGSIYDRQTLPQEAEKQYEMALKKVSKDASAISRLSNSFSHHNLYDYAIRAYTEGSKGMEGDRPFAFQLANLYQRKGDYPKMIDEYLYSIYQVPDRYKNIQRTLQRVLPKDSYAELQAQLYAYIQDYPDENIPFIELLTWSFIQQKDFEGAARQAKALDRRLNENGSRVYRLARMAANAEDYDAAISAYEYLIERRDQTAFFVDAKKEALSTLRKKITGDHQYSSSDLSHLKDMYSAFLNDMGKNRNTAPMMVELAELEAFYLDDAPAAIQLLNELIEIPGVDKITLANAKLRLADLYLISGDRWEATLLYSQVDKAHEDDETGHQARFRNAKLSYYFGDFEWAQSQFEVLKASTSKLIANDALDLSVFILDNLGLDTSATSLQMYATGDLLVFQNKYNEAFAVLDSLLAQFPDHSLQDDVYYTKAKAYRKLRKYDQAKWMYQKVFENFPDDIRADNALFELADMYENILDKKSEAQALYEKIFIDYSGSTFAVEARKRYRILRGDRL